MRSAEEQMSVRSRASCGVGVKLGNVIHKQFGLNGSRAGLQENSAILKELVELRAQKCALLGFTTHADFILEMNMAKSGKKVASFLGESWEPSCSLRAAVGDDGGNYLLGDFILAEINEILLWSVVFTPRWCPVFLCCLSEDLARKLKPLGEEERAVILKLKEKECQKRGLPFNGELHAWDTRYYMTQVRAQRMVGNGVLQSHWCSVRS